HETDTELMVKNCIYQGPTKSSRPFGTRSLMEQCNEILRSRRAPQSEGWCLIHSKQTQILDNHGQVDDDEVIIDSPLLPYQISHDFLSQFGSSLPDLIDFNDVKPASFLRLFLS
ncbi:Os10g0420900, partial [Oryza sativa Japonica Group]